MYEKLQPEIRGSQKNGKLLKLERGMGGRRGEKRKNRQRSK